MARFAAAVWQLAHHLHPHESLVEERCAGSGIRAVAAYSAHSYQNRSRRAGQHRHQGASRWDRGAKKNGPQAIGKSRGGWTTKIHMVAADARTAITFALSPGQHHDAPAGRQLLRKMGKVSSPLYLLMDRAYEGDETRQLALDLGFIPVVPPKQNRVTQWEYNRAMYGAVVLPLGNSILLGRHDWDEAQIKRQLPGLVTFVGAVHEQIQWR